MKGNGEFITFLKGFARGKRALVLLVALLAVLAAVFIYEGRAEGEGAGNETEARISEICSAVDGVGECKVMVTFEEGTESGKVYSVAVICEGADDVAVRARIIDLMTSLYGIGSNRVSVVKLEK